MYLFFHNRSYEQRSYAAQPHIATWLLLEQGFSTGAIGPVVSRETLTRGPSQRVTSSGGTKLNAVPNCGEATPPFLVFNRIRGKNSFKLR